MLEKEKEEPKAVLDPAEESKLSGDMRELYDRLLPTPESDERRKRLVKKLERILREEWPGDEFKVHVFGSSGNLLCTTDSDGRDHTNGLVAMTLTRIISRHLHPNADEEARNSAHVGGSTC